jgi:protein-serine/threonine kinase
MNRSSATTRSNTPPSPTSPLEMANQSRDAPAQATVPAQEDFLQKKNRASTGVGFTKHIAFTSRPKERPARRRASSFDYSKKAQNQEKDKEAEDEQNPAIAIERSLWGLPADEGTGVKARRMSLSLPDDFTVDLVDLLKEFEYQSKLLGRHGKHLGKGATSKVTLMARRGCPGELYAVKEFRGKSSSETREDYEKKIKSEFSVAKSLHHPSIVETVRLCTDHGRWDHVMEYCSEGDLFSLVQKKYLQAGDREKDRLCLFKQLVQGIHYLHSNGIAHRDIKLENLLMTKDSKLKITDFGVSEVFCGIHPGLREAGGQCGVQMAEVRLCPPGICGSEPYIAPEVLSKKEHYDPRALDVWSTAIVMIYLIFGGAIWTRADVAQGGEHYQRLVRGWDRWIARHPEKDDKAPALTDSDYPAVSAFDQMVNPPALRRILLQMLNPNPAKRIAIGDVVNNRWFKKIECCQLESYDDPTATQMIDASRRNPLQAGMRKIYCHNHLPPAPHTGHSLGKMPGSAGY